MYGRLGPSDGLLYTHEDTPLFRVVDNVLVPQAVQIGLRDLDVLMSQQSRDGIEVCSHFHLLLGVEMAAGVRRHADTLYSLSISLDDVLDR